MKSNPGVICLVFVCLFVSAKGVLCQWEATYPSLSNVGRIECRFE